MKTADPTSLFDSRNPRLMPVRDKSEPPISTPANPPVSAPVPDASHAKFGIYSDGAFCIERGTETMWLSAPETAELAAFIAKIHL